HTWEIGNVEQTFFSPALQGSQLRRNKRLPFDQQSCGCPTSDENKPICRTQAHAFQDCNCRSKKFYFVTRRSTNPAGHCQDSSRAQVLQIGGECLLCIEVCLVDRTQSDRCGGKRVHQEPDDEAYGAGRASQ